MKLLIVSATPFEIMPLVTYLSENWQVTAPGKVFIKGTTELHICITGIGIMAATYTITKAFAAEKYDFALQAGVGGTFDQSIHPGNLVLISSEQTGDLGAEDNGSFIDIFSMGLIDKDQPPFADGKLINSTTPLPYNLDTLQKATGLTVNTVSGHQPTIDQRTAQYNCQTESMEGAPFHFICLQENIPFAQVRAISNYVAPRDRSKWKMKEAIVALNEWLVREVAEG